MFISLTLLIILSNTFPNSKFSISSSNHISIAFTASINGFNQEVVESSQISYPLVDSILAQTEADQANSSIIDQIDQESGYKTDENFFQWLFKGKSKR